MTLRGFDGQLDRRHAQETVEQVESTPAASTLAGIQTLKTGVRVRKGRRVHTQSMYRLLSFREDGLAVLELSSLRAHKGTHTTSYHPYCMRRSEKSMWRFAVGLCGH